MRFFTVNGRLDVYTEKHLKKMASFRHMGKDHMRHAALS